MRDKYGVEINVGDTIVYAVKRSTSVDIYKAKVTGIRDEIVTVDVQDRETRSTKLRSMHNVIKV